jgi:hypothetical protein
MSSESFPSRGNERANQVREQVRVAAFEKAVQMLKAEFESSEKHVAPEAAEDILYSFLEEQVDHAKRFESKESGVSFVFSSVDVSTIAKKLYQEYTGKFPELKAAPEGSRFKKEFLFESFLTPRNPGALFTFFEQALHHVISELPAALADIEAGREPKRHDIYFVGHPTRDLGHLSPEFVVGLKNNHAFEKYGELYTEFIADVLKNSPDTTNVFLRGLSLGAPQALETAKHLLDQRLVTQSHKEASEEQIPYLQVRIDTPPSQNDISPDRRRWQVPIGFAAHAVQALVTDPYVRATSNPMSGFVRELMPLLGKRGIHEDMSPEQEKLKKEAIALIHENLYAGVPIPEGMKVTEVVGLSDLTMFSPELRADIAKQRTDAREEKMIRDISEHLEANPEASNEEIWMANKDRPVSSLGENVATPISENRRTFGLFMGHNVPNFIPNELGRLERAASALEKLRIRH